MVCRITGPGSIGNQSAAISLNVHTMNCGSCGVSLKSSTGSCRCAVCDVKFCGKCTFRTEDSDLFTCIACLGHNVFYDKLRNKAEEIYQRVEEALLGKQRVASIRMQELCLHFYQTVDVLNRLLYFSVLQRMWPLLLKIVKYQEDHGLEGNLGTLQALKLHAEPRALHSELVQRVALLNAKCIDCPPERNYPKLVRSKQPTLGIALSGLHGHFQIWQLLHTPLLQLLERAKSRGDLKILIFATQRPNLELSFVLEMYRAFSAEKCWLDVFDDKTGALPTELTLTQQSKFRRMVREQGTTAVLDCSSCHGSEAFRVLCRPGSETRFTFGYLEPAVLPRNSSSCSGVILDPVSGSSTPVPDDGFSVCHISCWKPPVIDSMRGLNRSKRAMFRQGNGQKFCIHTPVDCDGISHECLKQLLELLEALPDAILCFDGATLTQITATIQNMQLFAVEHGLSEHYFDGRVDWWGQLPVKGRGQRIRDNAQVCLALGPSSGDIGVNLALCVGVPVVTNQGSHGGATSFLVMIGLGALAGSDQPADLVKQLYNDANLLMSMWSILDHQAENLTGFFNLQRTANDLAEFVIAHHESSDRNPPTRKFISCKPEPPYFELDQHGKLQQTAGALVREGNDQLETDVLPGLQDYDSGMIVEIDADFETSRAEATAIRAEALMLSAHHRSDVAESDADLDLADHDVGAECEPASPHSLNALAAQAAPDGKKWPSVFHDQPEEGPKGQIRVGDGAKIMSDRLSSDSMFYASAATFIDLTMGDATVDEGDVGRAAFGEPPSAGDLLV